MVRHILKKDVRLLWVFALAVATIHLANATLRCWLGVFQEPNQLIVVADLLSLVSFLGIVALTIAVIHQDPVPGVRQDWLTRPIRRGDILLAKLLFIVLVVQGPLLLADLIEGLVDGFSLAACFAAATARNVSILCFLSLPAMMIGAVTRDLMESFIVSVAGLIVYVAIFMVGVVLLAGVRTSVGGTGLSWMVAATWYALAATGTAGVMSLQFFRRNTAVARCLIGAGGAAIILSSFLPWRAAFALQESLSSELAGANAIALAFNRQMGHFKLPLGAAAATSAALYLPLHVTGVPSATLMLTDRANVRIVDIGGRTLYQGRSNLSVDGVGSIRDAQLEVRQTENGNTAKDVYQRIFIPANVYARVSHQPVRLEIDYYLTLFRAQSTQSFPAVGARGWLKDLGWCATRVDGEGDDIEMRCVNTRRTPCFTAYLEHSPSGLRNPETHACEPDYTPFEANVWPDTLSRFGGKIPFFDRSSLIHYPVDGAKLADARVVIETYVPRDHFTRHLTIPNVQLADFAGPLAVSGDL